MKLQEQMHRTSFLQGTIWRTCSERQPSCSHLWSSHDRRVDRKLEVIFRDLLSRISII